jgi:outer membrane lipoprotein SlyB
MKKNFISVASLILVLTVAGCSTTQSVDNSQKPGQDLQIIAKVRAPEGALAGITLNPLEYLDSKFQETVVGAVKGEITDVQYTSLQLGGGEDLKFSLTLAQTIMTIKVQSSTFSVAEEIKVATSGGYLSPTVEGIYGRPDGDLGTEGVIQYETAGGSEPPLIGQSVILFLQRTEGSLSKIASYSVTGSAFGRFTLDEDTGLYSRKLEGHGDSAKFRESDLVGDLLADL